MEVTASAVTLVGLALNSTQVVYRIVSGIINAPQTIQQLTSNLRELSNVLQQLNGFGNDLYLSSELPQLIAGCAEYMREFEAKVSKLHSPKDKKVARLWKNVKATLQEQELDRMTALVHQHFMVLFLHLSIIKGKLLERIDNRSNRQAALSTTHTTILADTKTGVDQMSRTLGEHQTTSETSTQGLSNAIHAVGLDVANMSTEQATLSTTHTTILENTKTGVDQISRRLGDLQTASQTSTHGLSNAMDAVGDKLLNVANMSMEQSTRMDSILELMKRLALSDIFQQHEAKTGPREAVLSSNGQETDPQSLGPSNNDLEEALNRLSNLVKEKEQILSSVEAESIIQDVGKILVYLLKVEEHHMHHDLQKKRRRAYDEADASDVRDLQYEHDVKRMKRILNASDRIALKEKVGQCQRVVDKRLRFKTTCCVQSSSNGSFTIRARRGIQINAASHDMTRDTSPDELLESLDFSVIYIPKCRREAYIAFALSQRTFLESCSLRTPALSVSALISDDSEVFQVIKNGELDRLMKMLALRQASLTDRDTRGRCLLNHALRSYKPNICEFLIHEGADIDFVEQSNRWMEPALHICVQGSISEWNDSDCRARADECCRHLLEAGADPTISTPNSISPAMDILLETQKSSLATLLNHGFEFLASGMDLREMVDLCIRMGSWTLDGIDFLLRLSGSTLPVQNLTCTLLPAIQGSIEAYESELLQVLILLMKNGADVTGQMHLVSEYACNPGSFYKVGRSHDYFISSISNRDLRLRQIWAEALAACGYDAEEFILQSMRIMGFPETNKGSSDPSGTISDEEDIPTAGYISQPTRFEEMRETDDEGCEDQNETVSDEDNISSTEDQPKLPEVNEEAFNREGSSPTDHASQPLVPTPYNPSDWALLEEDARVWQD